MVYFSDLLIVCQKRKEICCDKYDTQLILFHNRVATLRYIDIEMLSRTVAQFS